MPTAYVLVQDDTNNSPLVGAAISGIASTSCCSGCWYGCSCNGCSSGNGYNVTENTGNDGKASWDTVYNCAQDFALTITAVGYHNTSVQLSRGMSDNDNNYTVSMTPLANVPQSNQGASGTTTGATSQGTTAASSAIGSHSLEIAALILLLILGMGVYLVAK